MKPFLSVILAVITLSSTLLTCLCVWLLYKYDGADIIVRYGDMDAAQIPETQSAKGLGLRIWE